MFVVRCSRGQITAAYLDEQFAGQEWLPIDSRSLQLFLVAAPLPRPSASSSFWVSTDASAVPGLRALDPAAVPGMTAPQTPGMQIPTPMGWLSPDMARRMLAHMAPTQESVAQAFGAPMDGMAWIARKLGVKGIPGGYADADPITQGLNGRPQVWQPSADVPLSSQHIRRLLDQYIGPGGLL